MENKKEIVYIDERENEYAVKGMEDECTEDKKENEFMKNEEIVELIGKIKKGDNAAWNELYRQFEKYIYPELFMQP